MRFPSSLPTDVISFVAQLTACLELLIRRLLSGMLSFECLLSFSHNTKKNSFLRSDNLPTHNSFGTPITLLSLKSDRFPTLMRPKYCPHAFSRMCLLSECVISPESISNHDHVLRIAVLAVFSFN